MGVREDFKSVVDRSIVDLTLPSNTHSIAKQAFWSCVNLVNITIPDSVVSIGSAAFLGCSSLTSATVGSGVNSIESGAFGNSTGSLYIKTITFKQPSGMAVSLPTAGSSSGLFYCKTASTLVVYTDNETIKNYDYATDNVTATIYHLDGSAWA